MKFSEVPYEVQNGLFGIIAILPKAFEKEKVSILDFINIFGIIEYMKENIFKNKILSRKISIIVGKWIKYFPGI